MDTVSSDSVGRFLTVADTADILNVSPADVIELVRSAELPAISVGSPGRWRIERAVLEAYIENKYEETRRMGLWQEADLASLPEVSNGVIRRPEER
jgi:excisionase family DNA binding protein